MEMTSPIGFRILGPVTAVDAEGAPLPVGGPLRRAVLAALLLQRGGILSVDRLVDMLWS
jgi:DNA-binding SARP family transcriptional activator